MAQKAFEGDYIKLPDEDRALRVMYSVMSEGWNSAEIRYYHLENGRVVSDNDFSIENILLESEVE